MQVLERYQGGRVPHIPEAEGQRHVRIRNGRDIDKLGPFLFKYPNVLAERRKMADLPLKAGMFVQPANRDEKPYLIGSRCRACGYTCFPRKEVCVVCRDDTSFWWTEKET